MVAKGSCPKAGVEATICAQEVMPSAVQCGLKSIYYSSCCFCTFETAFEDLNLRPGVVEGRVKFGPVKLSPTDSLQLSNATLWKLASGGDVEALIRLGEREIERYDIFLVDETGADLNAGCPITSQPVQKLDDNWDGCCLSALYSTPVSAEVKPGAKVSFWVVPITNTGLKLPGQKAVVTGGDCCAGSSSAVVGTFDISTSDPEAFARDPEVAKALAESIAAMAGVPKELVKVVVTTKEVEVVASSIALPLPGGSSASASDVDAAFATPEMKAALVQSFAAALGLNACTVVLKKVGAVGGRRLAARRLQAAMTIPVDFEVCILGGASASSILFSLWSLSTSGSSQSSGFATAFGTKSKAVATSLGSSTLAALADKIKNEGVPMTVKVDTKRAIVVQVTYTIEVEGLPSNSTVTGASISSGLTSASAVSALQTALNDNLSAKGMSYSVAVVGLSSAEVVVTVTTTTAMTRGALTIGAEVQAHASIGGVIAPAIIGSIGGACIMGVVLYFGRKHLNKPLKRRAHPLERHSPSKNFGAVDVNHPAERAAQPMPQMPKAMPLFGESQAAEPERYAQPVSPPAGASQADDEASTGSCDTADSVWFCL